MDEKCTTYWRVKSAEGEGEKPRWEQLAAASQSTEGLHGDLKIENDDQIMWVYFVDAAAQEHVSRAARDAAALAQEWEIPHRPWNTPTD
ncbi:MAG: hypothetical protein OEW52_11050 [Thermoleophilia bacterium]|nr:hypothetical protein [Thermoleophilia bacterium]MDH5281669.1 hypothetical protein [Thermoleophilia bacterium]